MKWSIYIIIALAIISSCKSDQELGHKVTAKKSSYFEALIGDSINYNEIRVYDQRRDSIQLVFLLHGHGGNHDDWFEEGEGSIQNIMSELGDSLNTNFLMVSLDAGNSWYVDRHLPMESIYINSFIPFIIDNYSASEIKEMFWLAGNSAGGYGALRLTLKNPELFSEVLLLSAAAYNPIPPDISSSRKIDVFADEQGFNDSIWMSYNYPNITIQENTDYPHYQITSGRQDKYGTYEVLKDIALHFDTLNINYDTTAIDGGHDWKTWKILFRDWIIQNSKSL